MTGRGSGDDVAPRAGLKVAEGPGGQLAGSWLALSSFADTLSRPRETVLRDSMEEHWRFLTREISDGWRESRRDSGCTQHPRNSDCPSFS